ncbi:MAG: sugar-binding protein [Bacteroidota bacterium]
MSFVKVLVLLAFLFSAFWVPEAVAAEISKNQKSFSVSAVKIQNDITLTGRLSDPLWRSAPTVECPYEVQPGENTPANQRTFVKILYNSRFIYFGFVCCDNAPSAIRAHISDRDNIFGDDFVFVAIDTYEDNQRAYEFVANPYGIQGDLMRTGSNEDASWDAVWYSKGTLNDTGYVVEIAVPFKSIHFPSNKLQNWTIALIRNFPRASRQQFSWTPFDRNDPCSICQGGTLRGLRDLQATGTFEVLPYVMGFQSGNLTDENDPTSQFSNGKVDGRVGGGVKFSPNPSLFAEAVINPDFSQVESDATQISVNSSYAIYYPEKRPFFLDGADIFNTQFTDFYSRMINNPIGAAKLIEKSDGLTIAYLTASDRNSPFTIAQEEGSESAETSLRSYSNILRAKYDFGTQSFLGALGTARNFTDAHNYTGGIDWNLYLTSNYSIRGQLLASNTKEVNDTTIFADNSFFGSTKYTPGFDGQTYNGTALYSQFRRDARDYSFYLTYQNISPTFQAENGFITENDLRIVDLQNYYNFYPVNSLIDQGQLWMENNLQFDYINSRKQDWTVAGIYLQLKSQTNINLFFLPYNEELYHSVRFNKINRGELQVNSAPATYISASLDVQLGRFIDRDSALLGYGHNITASVALKPTSQLELDISYSRSRLSDVSTQELFYDGYITRFTGIYQFSSDVFLRLIGQYDQFNKAVEIDPLLSYKLNPFTICYVGSTHDLTDFDSPYGFEQTERQFFIKLQYLWRE